MHGPRRLSKTLMRMYDALWPGSRTGGIENCCNLIGRDFWNGNGASRETQKIVKGTRPATSRDIREVTKF